MRTRHSRGTVADLANLTARALCPHGVIQARPMHLLPSHRAHSGPYLPSAPSAHVLLSSCVSHMPRGHPSSIHLAFPTPLPPRPHPTAPSQQAVEHLTSIRDFPVFEGDFFPDHLKTMLEPPEVPARAYIRMRIRIHAYAYAHVHRSLYL